MSEPKQIHITLDDPFYSEAGMIELTVSGAREIFKQLFEPRSAASWDEPLEHGAVTVYLHGDDGDDMRIVARMKLADEGTKWFMLLSRGFVEVDAPTNLNHYHS